MFKSCAARFIDLFSKKILSRKRSRSSCVILLYFRLFWLFMSFLFDLIEVEVDTSGDYGCIIIIFEQAEIFSRESSEVLLLYFILFFLNRVLGFIVYRKSKPVRRRVIYIYQRCELCMSGESERVLQAS